MELLSRQFRKIEHPTPHPNPVPLQESHAMLIEFHVIQDHGPSNMNRGQDGRPKTAFYAGSLRLRISSQCWKRALRQPRQAGREDVQPGVFERTVGSSHFGVRTRLLPEKVAEKWCELHGAAAPFVAGIKAAVSIVAKTDGKPEEAKDGRVRTPQAIYLDLEREVDRIISVLNKLHADGELEQLANESQVFADHLKDAAKQFGWDWKEPKEPFKSISWDAVKSEWNSIVAAAELLDLPDRPTVIGATASPEMLIPSREVADGVLKLLMALKEDGSEDEAKKLAESLKPKRGKAPSGSKKELAKLLELTAQQSVFAADIALFGRMTTSAAFRDVEAACQVADGISTHPADIENDLFVAVDDIDPSPGAAYFDGTKNSNQFASAVFYHNLVVDFDELLRNLGATIPKGKEDDAALKTIAAEAGGIANKAIEGLLRAVMQNVPSGKINSHAHNQQPSLILVEVKQQKLATNYLTAFHDPARRGEREDGSVETLLTDSSRKLLAFARYRDRKMKTEGTQRFLFINDQETEDTVNRLRESLKEGSSSPLTDDTFFKNSSLKTCDDFDSFVAAVNDAVNAGRVK